MQDDTAYDLHGIRLYADNSPHSLAEHSKSVRQDIVESLSLCESFFKDVGLVFQFLVRHCLIHRLSVEDRLLCTFYSF